MKGGGLGVLRPHGGSEMGPPPMLEAGVSVEALLPSSPGLFPAAGRCGSVPCLCLHVAPHVLLIPPASLLRTPAARSGLTS